MGRYNGKGRNKGKNAINGINREKVILDRICIVDLLKSLCKKNQDKKSNKSLGKLEKTIS
jgi:hypothetical protein